MAAEYFTEACLHLGQWDKLDDILDYAPNDSDRCNIMAALNALNKRDFERVNECLEHGFSLIASRPISFLVEHQKLHQDTVYSAQRLIEVAEMKEWLADPSTQRAYEDLWLQRMRTAPRDFELWFDLIANRQSITKLHNDFLIKFFELKSPTPNTKAHSTTFDILFPNHNFETAGELEKICYVVAQWSTGNKKFAIEMMKNLVNECYGSLRVRARLLYATWLMELDESLEGNKIAYENLQEVYNRLYNNKSRSYRAMSCEINSPSPHRSGRISRVSSAVGSDYYAFTQAAYRELTVDVEKIEVMRRWAFVSSELIGLDPKNSDEYVTRAIECLTECTRLSPSFSDVVQLLNLFFDFASRPTVFEKTEQSIRMLPIKLLLQASPQILVQLSHGSPNVAMAVHNLVFHLMTDHYHGLVFSLMVMQSGSKLTSFKFPSSIAKIGSSAFSKCSDLISLEFEDGCPLLKTLETSCFSETKIESIEVPKGVRKIKDNCFGFCSKLKNVTLPDGLAEIGVRSFICCDLREIILPLSAVKIGEGAFSANSNLRRVYYCGEETFQDRTVFVNSAKSIEVYTMSNYSETTLCGIECKRVMRRCMFLPSAEFSVKIMKF